MSKFSEFDDKMRQKSVGEAAILAFERAYEMLVSGASSMMPEEALQPAEDVAMADSLPEAKVDSDLLKKSVVIKLNGGLGTSMGLQQAKSLLEVREGQTFLDLIACQSLSLKKETGIPVRLLLMNSFSTSGDTLAHMARYADEDLARPQDIELMQNQVPKVSVDTLSPLSWPADPSLEWCPPGHGDLYPALLGSGWLKRLLDSGVRYAFVSNSDNLGAVLDAKILSHFAHSEAPFMMEVTRRTESDRKGGHLARRRSDGRLVLREVAQCPEDDLGAFQDIGKHQFFNTNNLWLRLDKLQEAMASTGGVLPLPMICNKKTADPRDKGSPAVYQLESAMGAAIECFEGAQALEVPRSRFAPVKSTGDLLSLRSDAYEVRSDGSVGLVASRAGVPPLIKLSDHYKLVDSLDQLGVPSLREATSLEIDGLFGFEGDVAIRGEVTLQNSSDERKILKDCHLESERRSF